MLCCQLVIAVSQNLSDKYCYANHLSLPCHTIDHRSRRSVYVCRVVNLVRSSQSRDWASTKVHELSTFALAILQMMEIQEQQMEMQRQQMNI